MYKSRNLKRIAPYFAAIFFITLILYFTRDQWHQFKNLRDISLSTIVGLSVLFILMQIVNGYILKMIIETFGIKLRVTEWFGLLCVQAFGNYLPLNTGVASNAVYLKYKKELPITKFMSYMIGQTAVMILTYGIWSIILLFIRYFRNYDFNMPMFLISVGFVLFGIAIILLPVSKINSNNRIVTWIKRIHNGWILIKQQEGLIIKIVILQTITLVILSLRYIIVFNDLGYELDIFAIVVLTIAVSIIRFTSILPGNLGLRESISGSVTKLFGLMFSAGVMSAMVIRIVSMFWIFLLGIVFSFILAGEKKVELEKVK